MPQKHYVFNYALLIGSLFAVPCLAQTHNTSQTTTAALKEVLKRYLKQQDVENEGSTRYIASFVDLNDDGKKEVIVHVIAQSLCGTGRLSHVDSGPSAVLIQHRRPNFCHSSPDSRTEGQVSWLARPCGMGGRRRNPARL
jgi:hypothetical protein